MAHGALIMTNSQTDYRLWREEEWGDDVNYIVVSWLARKGRPLSACLQMYHDFRKATSATLGVQWEDRCIESVGEVQARHADGCDEVHNGVRDHVKTLEGSGMFDAAVFIPRRARAGCNNGVISEEICCDEASVVKLTWGLDYSSSAREAKFSHGYNYEMGTGWTTEFMCDGVIVATYKTTDDREFIAMVEKMTTWKKKDRIAYSNMELLDRTDRKIAAREKDEGCPYGYGQSGDDSLPPAAKKTRVDEAPNESQFGGRGEEGFDDASLRCEELAVGSVDNKNEHRGRGALARIRHKSGAYPVHKYKSVWYKERSRLERAKEKKEREQEMEERQREEEEEQNRREEERQTRRAGREEVKQILGDDRRIRAFFRGLPDSSDDEDAQTKVQPAAKTRDEKWRERLRRDGLPPPPTNEFEQKLERLTFPGIVATRDLDLDLGKEFARWFSSVDLGEGRSIDPLTDEWMAYCRKYGGTLLPVGNGAFFNGYFRLEKRDFYRKNKILGWVPILKRDFPSWENYGDWYWERADLAGLSDDRYDSDGNTLSMSEDLSDGGCDKDDASDQSIQRIVNGFVGVDEMPSDDEDFGLGNDHGP